MLAEMVPLAKLPRLNRLSSVLWHVNFLGRASTLVNVLTNPRWHPGQETTLLFILSSGQSSSLPRSAFSLSTMLFRAKSTVFPAHLVTPDFWVTLLSLSFLTARRLVVHEVLLHLLSLVVSDLSSADHPGHLRHPLLVLHLPSLQHSGHTELHQISGQMLSNG